MTQTEILNSNLSKSDKMRKLFELGLTRKEVAELMQVGYGFAQNVYAKIYGVSRMRTSTTLSFLETFVFNHKFGIEIEAYGIGRDLLASKLREAGIESNTGSRTTSSNVWKVTTDGSISGRNSFELVSPILEGQDGIEQLKKVCEVLKRNNALINKSCGLHIHFDARQFELEHWKGLYKNYARLEDTIDSFIVPSRRENNNTYCNSVEVWNWESRVTNARNLNEIGGVFSSKYYKVNVQPFWRQGSVEFRHHSGSIEFEKISNWIFFLARLIELSKTKAFSTGTFDTLREFCNQELIDYLANRIQKLNPSA